MLVCVPFLQCYWGNCDQSKLVMPISGIVYLWLCVVQRYYIYASCPICTCQERTPLPLHSLQQSCSQSFPLAVHFCPMERLENDATENMVFSNLSPPNPIDNFIDSFHQIVILQFHIDSFFAGTTLSQHVTDDYHQPEIFIVPLISYHTHTHT